MSAIETELDRQFHSLHSRTTIAERWDRFHHVSTGRQFSRPWTAFRPAKEKKQQPDAYELSRLAVKAESDMPLPQAATLPPMRVATRTTDPTVTLNDDEVGSGTGTTPKRSVEIGVTESVVGTTPIASTAVSELFPFLVLRHTYWGPTYIHRVPSNGGFRTPSSSSIQWATGEIVFQSMDRMKSTLTSMTTPRKSPQTVRTILEM